MWSIFGVYAGRRKLMTLSHDDLQNGLHTAIEQLNRIYRSSSGPSNLCMYDSNAKNNPNTSAFSKAKCLSEK
jgi:hypothetical protein